MKIENLRKAYGEQVVFDGFDLEIREGEILCLLGPSGVGKTTLLKILAGLTPYEGRLDGIPERVGYIFQEPRLLANLTVRENLAFTGGEAKKIGEMLEEVGLSAHADKRPKMLSGGEKQRVAIARAFLSDSPLLLMDEPFSALDTALKMRLTDLFLRIWEKEKRTALFVTHDLGEALAVGHRIVVLKKGAAALDIRADEENAKEKLLECLMTE